MRGAQRAAFVDGGRTLERFVAVHLDPALRRAAQCYAAQPPPPIERAPTCALDEEPRYTGYEADLTWRAPPLDSVLVLGESVPNAPVIK